MLPYHAANRLFVLIICAFRGGKSDSAEEAKIESTQSCDVVASPIPDRLGANKGNQTGQITVANRPVNLETGNHRYVAVSWHWIWKGRMPEVGHERIAENEVPHPVTNQDTSGVKGIDLSRGSDKVIAAAQL